MSEGTHVAHCCITHGCKYGDSWCPVANGRLKQEFPCEDCQWEEDESSHWTAPKDKEIAELKEKTKLLEDSRDMWKGMASDMAMVVDENDALKATIEQQRLELEFKEMELSKLKAALDNS